MKEFLSKKKYVIIIACASLLVLGGVLAYVFSGGTNYVIAEGVSVAGVDIGGMTKAEAESALIEYEDFAEDILLTFDCEGTIFSVPASQLELKADIKKTVDEAYKIGRSKDSQKNKEDLEKARRGVFPIDIKLSYNADKLHLAAGENLGDKLIDPEPMRVEYGSDYLLVINSKSGIIVEPDKAIRAMEKELSDLEANSPIPLELKEYTPPNLTFEEFKEKYVKEAKDAVYTEEDGKYHIEPEVIGVEIDEAEAKAIFEANKDSEEPYKIPAKITMPSVTAKYLEDKYVNKIMASYTTSFAGSSWGRCQNIALAASKIDGYVVNPGERFSYNTVVGPRTEAAGFKLAHVYVGTKTVDGIGGGICQVSSTLYNAVVMADLKTVSRTNHSIPVSYVPLGRDATVSYGTIDYVFENDKTYPVSIKATVDGTNLTISIVGTSEMDYTVEFVTKYISSIAYGETQTEDSELACGETKVISEGSNGSVYESYRVYKRGGTEFDRKLESKSRYQPIAKEVAVGTKKEDIPPEKTEVSENEEPTTEDEQGSEEPSEEVPQMPSVPEEIPSDVNPEFEEPAGDVEDEIIHPEN